jgi:hypothetical protein
MQSLSRVYNVCIVAQTTGRPRVAELVGVQCPHDAQAPEVGAGAIGARSWTRLSRLTHVMRPAGLKGLDRLADSRDGAMGGLGDSLIPMRFVTSYTVSLLWGP